MKEYAQFVLLYTSDIKLCSFVSIFILSKFPFYLMAYNLKHYKNM